MNLNKLKELTILEVCDILRKDIKNYLWDKRFNEWNDKDYFKLKELIDGKKPQVVNTNKRKTIKLVSKQGEYFTFNTYDDCSKFLRVDKKILSIAIKKKYRIKEYKII